MIKDRNNKDLKEVQEIKKTTQEYREELYQKSQINTMKWSLTWSHISWNVKSSGPWEALLQTKLVEVKEFQLRYLKSLKMMLLKCCTQYASKSGKLHSGHWTGKGQFSFQSSIRAVPKNVKITIQLTHFTC